MKAVVDRIVDNKQAVLLIGDEEKELIVPKNNLPIGAKEGTSLQVELDGDKVIAICINEKETDERQRRIKDKMDQLRARGRKN